MDCLRCGGLTQVVSTHRRRRYVSRLRRCKKCGQKFPTQEREASVLTKVKEDVLAAMDLL